MKIIRWVLSIFLGLLILIVATIVMLVNFINPNDFRDDINKNLSATAGQPINIQGDIKWIFFPELGFSIQNILIGNQQDVKNLSADIDHVDIHLKLWPLLHKQVKINSLKLNGVTLNLPQEKADDGTKKPNATETIIKSGAAGFALLPMLDLVDLDVSNANINHRDNQGAVDWKINQLALHAKNLKANEEIPIDLKLNYQKTAAKLSADINLSTQLTLNTIDKQILVNNTDLKIITPEDSTLPINFGTQVSKVLFDLNNLKLVIQNVTGHLNQLHFSAQLTANNLADHLNAQGKFDVQTQTLKVFLANFGVHLPAMQSAQALSKLDFTAPFTYSDNQLNINPFVLKLDNNQFTGSIKSSDLANMAIQINAHTNTIALGNYLPAGPTPHTASLSQLQIDLSALPPLGENKNFLKSTLSTKISAQQINFDKFNVHNIIANVDAKNGLLKFNQLHLQIWQGVVDTTGSADLTGNQIKWTLNPNVQRIQVANIVQMVEPSINLTGLANLKGTVNSVGTSPDLIKKYLNGNLNVALTNGALHGVDLNYWLGMGEAIIHHTPPTGLTDHKFTTFGALTSNVQINQGVVNTPNILLKGDLVQMNGQGVADLNRQTLNYKLQIRKINANTGGTHNDVIPLLITGTFNNPQPSIDMKAITKAVFDNQKDRLSKSIAKQISKKIGGDSDLGNQIGDLAAQGIGNLINNL